MYSKLKPEGYMPRLTDTLIDSYLHSFGAVEISGTRWCGKSWTASAFAESVVRVDENKSLYQEEPSLALLGDKPHVVDEWQDVPAIWNVVRHHIDDQGNKPGQYILTGSSTPPEEEERHSGAGRIGRIRMRTMTLSETGVSKKTVSLKDLFEGKFENSTSDLNLEELAKIICRGGWPALQNRPGIDAKPVIDEYLEALFTISMPKDKKRSDLARKIAFALARNLGTSATLQTLAKDAATGEAVAPSGNTVAEYLSTFNDNYFLEELPGWDAPIKSKSRVRTKPKRYFDDPSLGAALLSVNEDRLLQEGQLFGVLFESLCVHDILVYTSLLPDAHSRSVRYYADADGLEVDIIIELRDGRWGAFEVKLGDSKVDEAAANLLRLRSKILMNPAARNNTPQFLGVLVGTGKYARQRKEDGVYIIPIDTLTA